MRLTTQLPRDSGGAPVPAAEVERSAPAKAILYVNHTGVMGGGEIALLNLVRYVDTARYQPMVVLFSDGPLARRLVEAGG